MDFKKFGNYWILGRLSQCDRFYSVIYFLRYFLRGFSYYWIEMNSKDQNLDFTRTKRIHFCSFQSIFVCWEWKWRIVDKNHAKFVDRKLTVRIDKIKVDRSFARFLLLNCCLITQALLAKHEPFVDTAGTVFVINLERIW